MVGLKWLNQAAKLHGEGKIDAAIDLIYNHVDELLIAGDFETVNDFLPRVSLKLPVDLLISILTITLAAHELLPNRKIFFDGVEVVVNEPNLLDGLEGE